MILGLYFFDLFSKSITYRLFIESDPPYILKSIILVSVENYLKV